ncbi:hypothetical protein [Nocardioides sp. URHA0032]|uniref:hypothetical protein n=1 Tax=Nocardioides sp. URHA0032 TaxID=1380388 RepID=UPI00048E25F4|nr:hypothetical protein [Nocardioides sp. URHA0032]
MADPDKDQPSLELPKLSLRRRKRPPAEPAPAPEPVPVPPVEETRPVVVDDPRPEPYPGIEPAPEPEPRRKARREREPGGMAAAVLTGLVVGLGIVGLTWASLRSCERVQGTSSCGDVGYPMLGLILVVLVLVGWLLLRLLRVPDPASTSFLGLGLAVVIALLVLVDHLLDRSMVVVVPLICALTFGVAHWVTRTFVEPPRD